MRELRIGDRVRTPYGTGYVTDIRRDVPSHGVRVWDPTIGPDGSWWDDAVVEPLPPDIPRDRVANLLATVEKRVDELADESVATHFPGRRSIVDACSDELVRIASALRLLLGGES